MELTSLPVKNRVTGISRYIVLGILCLINGGVNARFLPVTASPLKLAAWNVEWLSERILTPQQKQHCLEEARKFADYTTRPTPACRKGGQFRTARDFDNLRKHADRLGADIIALQEVESEAALRKLFAGNTYHLGIYPGESLQKSAIAIRKSVLKPGTLPEFSNFTKLGEPLQRDQRGALQANLILKNGRPVTVLSLHLKSRCVDEPLNTPTDNCIQLGQQAPVLSHWIEQQQAKNIPYFIMGDFNRYLPDNQFGKQGLTYWIDPNQNITTPPVIIPTGGLAHQSACYDSRYPGQFIEHILLGGGAEKGYVAGSALDIPYLDPRSGEVMTDHRQARHAYSDHCVVVAKWQP